MRVRYYEILREYFKVYVYGRFYESLFRGDKMLEYLVRYKFYLVFENFVYFDYITEKLWRNVLMFGVVFVVLGFSRSNYE